MCCSGVSNLEDRIISDSFTTTVTLIFVGEVDVVVVILLMMDSHDVVLDPIVSNERCFDHETLCSL